MKEEMTFEEIKEIIDLIRETDNVSAFTLKCGDVEISLSRAPDGQLAPVSAAAPPAAAPAPAPEPASAPPAEAAPAAPAAGEVAADESEVIIKAPMVGTFYRSPKPGDPPFVEEGGSVREDSVLCIIEVMKLMNSLEAKMKGTVTRILVEDAQPVEHGQPLMIIKAEGS